MLLMKIFMMMVVILMMINGDDNDDDGGDNVDNNGDHVQCTLAAKCNGTILDFPVHTLTSPSWCVIRYSSEALRPA